LSVGISSLGRTKLILICEDKWFVLPKHVTVATSFASHSFNIWTFLHISTRKCPGSPCSQNGCTANSQYVRFHEAVIAYWLLKNPDLNPVDYAIWGILQKQVHHCQVRDVGHSKEQPIYEWCRFDQPIIDRAVGQW